MTAGCWESVVEDWITSSRIRSHQLSRTTKPQQQQQKLTFSIPTYQQQISSTMVYTTTTNINSSNTTGAGTGGNNNVQVISSMHMDYINYIAFDVYGRRMATCSGDRFVRVWELMDSSNNNTDNTSNNNNNDTNTTPTNQSNDNNNGGTGGNTGGGEWILGAQWQAHRGSISCICWAHPEFGNLLATCGSSDHEAKIWEEMTPSISSNMNNHNHNNNQQQQQSYPLTNINTSTMNNNNNTMNSTSFYNHSNSNVANAVTAQQQQQQRSWTLKASLTEARRGVTCCEYAPRHWGLKIAIGSADGCVRIHEAVDIMNLTQWPLSTTLQCYTSHNETAASSNNDPTMNNNNNMNTMNHQTSMRSGGSVASSTPSTYPSTTTGSTNQHHHHHHYTNRDIGVTALSWCGGRFEPPTLVVGGTQLLIYRYSEVARAWQLLMQLPGTTSSPSIPQSMSSSSHILDVAWAPNVGRRYHYIATAEEDMIRIYKLNRQSSSSSSKNQQTTTKGDGKQQQQQNTLSLENVQIISTNSWRCQWNVTGTVLASSGDGGIVQLYKTDHYGQFVCVGKVQGDLSNNSSTTNNQQQVVDSTIIVSNN